MGRRLACGAAALVRFLPTVRQPPSSIAGFRLAREAGFSDFCVRRTAFVKSRINEYVVDTDYVSTFATTHMWQCYVIGWNNNVQPESIK
jgi:hypothetical protein